MQRHIERDTFEGQRNLGFRVYLERSYLLFISAFGNCLSSCGLFADAKWLVLLRKLPLCWGVRST